MRLARAAGPVQVAILPIGAYRFAENATDNHIGPDQAVTAFEQLDAAYAIGVHWGTFEGIGEPPEYPLAALAHARIPADRFRTPEACEAWIIKYQKPNDPPPPGGGVAEGDGGGGHGAGVALTSPFVRQEPATSPLRGRIERSNTAIPSS